MGGSTAGGDAVRCRVEAIGHRLRPQFRNGRPRKNRAARHRYPGAIHGGSGGKGAGPVDQPASSAAESRPITTLAVFGDADFASNPNFLSFSNGDLFLNVVNYVTGDDALISVRPKPVVFREMAMTPREFSFVRYTGWFLLPLLVGIAGFIAWWRRR